MKFYRDLLICRPQLSYSKLILILCQAITCLLLYAGIHWRGNSRFRSRDIIIRSAALSVLLQLDRHVFKHGDILIKIAL